MIDILMVTWYRPQITRHTLRALWRNTKPGSFRLVVVDNGSPPDMVAMLRRYRRQGLIHELVVNQRNRGLEPARNQLLKLATTDYIITTDSDCLPEPLVEGRDWLERLIDLADRHPDYAAIACRTPVMIGTGNIFEEADKNGDEIVQFGHPGGSLRLMRTEAVKQVGGWRGQEAGRGSEERHIGGLLQAAGWKTGFAAQINCLHLFGNRQQATDRWGYPGDWLPGDSGHSNVYHPALEAGDDPEEVAKFTGGTDD